MWKPKRGEPCPCASGKKFSECCSRRLPGFDIGKAYTRASRDKQPQRALVAARADITQYTIWHKSNTAPALARGVMVLELLRIDVDALGDYVGRRSSYATMHVGYWREMSRWRHTSAIFLVSSCSYSEV
jgi:hypothetical protein